MNIQDNATAASTGPVRHAPLSLGAFVAILAALMLGIVVLYGAGFAGADVLHNAAHDTRHALGYPCH